MAFLGYWSHLNHHCCLSQSTIGSFLQFPNMTSAPFKGMFSALIHNIMDIKDWAHPRIWLFVYFIIRNVTDDRSTTRTMASSTINDELGFPQSDPLTPVAMIRFHDPLQKMSQNCPKSMPSYSFVDMTIVPFIYKHRKCDFMFLMQYYNGKWLLDQLLECLFLISHYNSILALTYTSGIISSWRNLG